MHIASGLRRKRDEIAATIAAYEARIDAARSDLAALDQAARLFDLEAQPAETVIPRDRDALLKPKERLEAPRKANEKQRAGAAGQLTPPIARSEDQERQLTEEVAHAGTGPERIPVEFFYLDWP